MTTTGLKLTEMSLGGGEKKAEEEKAEKGGELLFCGATCWDIVGRKKPAPDANLVSPTRLRPLVGVDIRFVASGCGKFLSVYSFLSTKFGVKAGGFFFVCAA